MSYPSYPPNDQQPPVPPGASYGYGDGVPQGPQANQLALWSMIVGIVSLPLMCLCGAGFPTAIAALVMGFIAKGQIDQSGGHQTGSGQAQAGIYCGIGAIALFFIGFIGFFVIGFAGGWD